jgi:hypothetical protein
MIKTCIAGTVLALASMCGFAQPAGATPGIDQRQANQEKRIDKGIASGELTRREARRLEKQQAHINKAEDRAKADGVVTAAERKRLHHKQNNASANIYRQKHDRQDKN